MLLVDQQMDRLAEYGQDVANEMSNIQLTLIVKCWLHQIEYDEQTKIERKKRSANVSNE